MDHVTIYGTVEAQPTTGKRPYSAPRLRVYGGMKSLTATGTKGGSESIDSDTPDMFCDIDGGKKPVGCNPPPV